VGNLFFAPASITAALAAAWAGSQGETATERSRALRSPQEPAALRATIAALSSQTGDAAGSELSIANALWVQEGYPLLPEYLEFVQKYFGAAVEQADFTRAAEEARRAINAWVVARTRGLIQDLIAPGVLTEITRLVLVNALYFKGEWAAKFERWWTEPQPFHRADKAPVQVQLMRRKGSYRLLERPELQALELPYLGSARAYSTTGAVS
jgi:serpin B